MQLIVFLTYFINVYEVTLSNEFNTVDFFGVGYCLLVCAIFTVLPAGASHFIRSSCSYEILRMLTFFVSYISISYSSESRSATHSRDSNKMMITLEV